MLDIDYNTLKTNLLITQVYCENERLKWQKGDPAAFRSNNPVYWEKPAFNLSEWNYDPYQTGNEALFEYLYDIQLDNKKNHVVADKTKKIKGAIFAFKIDETLQDGAAAVETHGLIDDYNCPPVDTWFYMTETEQTRLLLAWIPDSLVKLFGLGIDVNPEVCIEWFKNWYPAEYNKIMIEINY